MLVLPNLLATGTEEVGTVIELGLQSSASTMVGRCNNDQVVAPLRVVKVAAARHKSTYSKSTAGTLSLWRGGSNSPPVIEELLRQVDEAL